MDIVTVAILASPAIAGALLYLNLKHRYRREFVHAFTLERLMVGGHLSGDVLLDNSHSQFPECHIVADGRRLDEPHCLVVAFLNAGNQPLLRNEFDCPLRISFPGSEFIGYAMRSPRAGLPLRVNVLGKSDLEIEPLLLNPGEGFAVSILVDGRPTDVQIDPRVPSTRRGPTEAEPVSLALLAALGQRLPAGPKGSAGSRLRRVGRSVARRFRQFRRS